MLYSRYWRPDEVLVAPVVEVEADLHGGVQLEAGEVKHCPAHEVVTAHHVAVVHLNTSAQTYV